jgi:glycosyltransferase involved in cell wall biosynthesis
MLTKPEVTVVIPTIGRESVLTAVRSVLKQTIDVEVIIALDSESADELLVRSLQRLGCEIVWSGGGGAAHARNVGASLARGKYIAFLDDDDEWFPNKLDTQIKQIEGSSKGNSCFSVGQSLFVRNSSASALVCLRKERKVFDPSAESIGNYLVKRTSLFYGSTYFQTSSLVLPLDLFLRTSWNESLSRHQDWDLFIELVDRLGATPLQVTSPVVRINQGSENSISQGLDGEASLSWLLARKSQITGRSRADFIWVNILADLKNLKPRQVGKIFSLCSLTTIPHLSATLRFAARLVLNR